MGVLGWLLGTDIDLDGEPPCERADPDDADPCPHACLDCLGCESCCDCQEFHGPDAGRPVPCEHICPTCLGCQACCDCPDTPFR